MTASERNQQTVHDSICNCVATGQLYNYNSRNNREYTSTNEGPPDDDDSYMGEYGSHVQHLVRIQYAKTCTCYMYAHLHPSPPSSVTLLLSLCVSVCLSLSLCLMSFFFCLFFSFSFFQVFHSSRSSTNQSQYYFIC